MTSPPDVQNVPDIFGLLERAHKALTGDYLSDETIAFMPVLEAALAVRERFVLVPKETEPSTEALNAGYARYRYAQDSGHDIDWRVVKECIYAVLAAAPKPEGKITSIDHHGYDES